MLILFMDSCFFLWCSFVSNVIYHSSFVPLSWDWNRNIISSFASSDLYFLQLPLSVETFSCKMNSNSQYNFWLLKLEFEFTLRNTWFDSRQHPIKINNGNKWIRFFFLNDQNQENKEKCIWINSAKKWRKWSCEKTHPDFINPKYFFLEY